MATLDESAWGDAWVTTLRGLKGTRAFAQDLARHLQAGAVLGLIGELGAGKTSFVQGLAAGLQVADLSQVLSPTYTLVNEYPTPTGMLVHIDFYRLTDEESARSLGIEEQLLRRDAVVAVEWANHLPEMLPNHTVWVKLTRSSAAARQCAVLGLPKPASA